MNKEKLEAWIDGQVAANELFDFESRAYLGGARSMIPLVLLLYSNMFEIWDHTGSTRAKEALADADKMIGVL